MLRAEWVHDQISGLMAVYTARPSAPIEAIVAIWLDHLGDMSEEEVRAGLLAHARDGREGKFWPTPAHVRGQVERLAAAQRQQVEGPTLGPEEEWQKVYQVAAGVGSYRTELARSRLGEGLWAAIGGGIGYAAICAMEADQIPSERARFCALRRTQTARAEADRKDRPFLELLEGGAGRRQIGAHPAPLKVGGGQR